MSLRLLYPEIEFCRVEPNRIRADWLYLAEENVDRFDLKKYRAELNAWLSAERCSTPDLRKCQWEGKDICAIGLNRLPTIQQVGPICLANAMVGLYTIFYVNPTWTFCWIGTFNKFNILHQHALHRTWYADIIEHAQTRRLLRHCRVRPHLCDHNGSIKQSSVLDRLNIMF